MARYRLIFEFDADNDDRADKLAGRAQDELGDASRESLERVEDSGSTPSLSA